MELGDEEAIDTTGGLPVVRDNTPQSSLVTAAVALAVVAVCVLVGALSNAQVGTLMLAGAALGGAAVRMVLPPGVAFSVRRRVIDVGLMLFFAAVLVWLGFTTPLA